MYGEFLAAFRCSVDHWLDEQRQRELTISESVEKWLTVTKMKPPRVLRGRRRRTTLVLGELVKEIRLDARRHGRSLSQSIHAAWALSREKIMSYPEPL